MKARPGRARPRHDSSSRALGICGKFARRGAMRTDPAPARAGRALDYSGGVVGSSIWASAGRLTCAIVARSVLGMPMAAAF